ncbi:hypothetical protein M569_03435 [Genlisea aurea]|uniref:CDT1 Geminin-binding domain-containing protein n=1 Tax=Genlisea aurea TaxID=192259 RepID=S8CWV3_9LAMI|nr:hypothetical protein M569_03435 [Genlisea aurea]
MEKSEVGKSIIDGFIDRSKVGILLRDDVEKISDRGNVESKKVSSNSVSDANLLSVKTPGKTSDTPRHIQRRRAALSIKDIKKEALRLKDKECKRIPAKTRSELGSEKDLHILIRQKKKPHAIPEKYEFLESFFNTLDSSIRLLHLRKYSTTFTNISSQIEKLTDQRFTFSHLAQLKFIMPEAIVVEKILQLDERTRCMKPELRIRLNVEAIEMTDDSVAATKNMFLRKLFRSRLLEFIKSHPEGDEVPEADLPAPFCRSKQNEGRNPVESNAASPQNSVQLGGPSHLSSSFRRRFSQRGSNASPEMKISSGSRPSAVNTLEVSAESAAEQKHKDQSSVLNTPEMASTPKLSLTTPDLHPPPRRCITSSPDDESFRSPSKLCRRPPPNRHLRFDTPVKVKGEEEVDRTTMTSPSPSSSKDDILGLLPDSLLRSIREKERIASNEEDPAVSRAKRRKQVMAGLPKTFDMIRFLFQSTGRSVMTREKVIHEIVSSRIDVVDRREVEEQLRYLRELAPEWIYEKIISSTGDCGQNGKPGGSEK